MSHILGLVILLAVVGLPAFGTYRLGRAVNRRRLKRIEAFRESERTRAAQMTIYGYYGPSRNW